MEEKKFDPYQFIGFILIALILTWMLYKNGPAEDDPNIKITNTEQVDSQNINNDINSTQSDSLIQQQKVAAYGDLGSLFKAIDQPVVSLKTDRFNLELNPKGGATINPLSPNSFLATSPSSKYSE